MGTEQRTARDGRPIYEPGGVPQGLVTYRELADRGLKPAALQVAHLDLGTSKDHLFDESNVLPRDADLVRIEMDRATAIALRNSLYGWGEHVAAGAPLPELSSEENNRLARLIDLLSVQLPRLE
jgi:hypothetical protein